MYPYTKVAVGDVIRHEKFLDIAYLVTSIEDGKISGHILNQAFTKTFFLNQQFTMYAENLSQGTWLKCDDPKLVCIRDSKWSPING